VLQLILDITDLKMFSPVSTVTNDRRITALLLCRMPSAESAVPGTLPSDYNPDEARLRSWLEYRFFRPVTVQVVKVGQEPKDRETALTTAKGIIRAGGCRFVLLSSLDWIGTGSDVFEFLELADKSKTNVVAVDDGADTQETDWRIIAMCAAMMRGLESAFSDCDPAADVWSFLSTPWATESAVLETWPSSCPFF
jgi:hypothetical protein